MSLRELTQDETKAIGRALGEPMVTMGHPLTCNGGNPDWRTHHDHEVLMLLDEHPLDEPSLTCSECGRQQLLPRCELCGVNPLERHDTAAHVREGSLDTAGLLWHYTATS